MIKIIFIKELQGYLLNKSLLLTWIIIISLFTVNAFVSVFQFNDLQKKYEDIVLENNQKLAFDMEGSGLMKELRSLFVGMPFEKYNTLPDMVLLKQKLSKSPSSLMFISSPLVGAIPDGVVVNCFEEPEFSSFIRFNPYMNSSFSIDWTTVIIYIITFFCICFSYNAFSGEKEDGTLKLLLGNSVSRSIVIIGKFLAILIIFFIPILVGILISCLIFELSPSIHLGYDELCKISYFFLVSMLLISATVLIGFFVSVLTKSSYVSLIICLVCWTTLAIIIPAISWVVIRQTNKIPAETYIYQEEEQQMNDLENCFMGWQSIDGIVPDQVALDRKNCVDRRTNVHNSLWSGYHNLQFEQTKNAIEISKISPFGLFRFLSDKISGNNYYGYLSFFYQTKDYQLTYQEYIFNKDKNDPDSRHLIWNEELSASLMSQQKVVPEEIPIFAFQQSSLQEIIADTLVDIFILCLWNIGLFIALFIAFIKYDVR